MPRSTILTTLASLVLGATLLGCDSTTPPSTTDMATGNEALACNAYCTSIMANCATDAVKQYSSTAECLGYCANIPRGLLSDMIGNTLGCRIYHAGAAKGDSATHCVHAGPGGGGAAFCGNECDSFCNGAMKTCSTAYASEAACKTACAAFKTTPAYTSAVTTGDSMACRLYHLTVASANADAAKTHCPHVTATAADPNNFPCK